MAEQAVPLPAPMTEILVLGRLIAARDAPRVALGGLHLGSTPVEVALLGRCGGWLRRPAIIKRVAPRFAAAHPRISAVRPHRSSLQSGFTAGYHLATG